MPFFRDIMDQEDLSSVPESDPTTTQTLPIHGLDQTTMLRYRPSEESIRTELCEGLLLPEEGAKPESLEAEEPCVTTTSDRAELIERLKRGESPTWVPNRRHETFFTRDVSRDHSPSPRPKSRGSPGLLTASLTKADTETGIAERMAQGLSIERPRSALHSGDFTPEAPPDRPQERTRAPQSDVFTPDRQAAAWFATSPPRDFTPFNFDSRRTPFPDLLPGCTYRSSPPSLSSSLSSSFVYKHPTSPLVQSESNEDPSVDSMDLEFGTPSRPRRRQTLHTFSHHMPATAQRIPGSTRRQSTLFPYQAHQPRKSLTSAPSIPSPLLPTSSPTTKPHPFPLPAASRRPSIALDSSSPLQQTSMVGSYEESILRGRMSTTPSKPLDFTAQIGVLGLGANCKPSLKCPAHVTLPFAAVFYSYGGGTGDDGPSPYVGQIDLENGLPHPVEAKKEHRRRRSSRQRSRSGSGGARERQDADMTGVDDAPHANASADAARDLAKHHRRHRGGGGNNNNSSAPSSSCKAPPGGSYRIPETGQLQIIIKNQNKTAVKLFLVPYDLAGMEPGTKTFIRQRAYSSSCISGDGGKEADKKEKEVLRYLVHLHICSPARGRHYLYKSVRVVFASRLPLDDGGGGERLRNEMTHPEPRFSPWRAVRQMPLPPSAPVLPSSGSLAASEAAAFSSSRRRTCGFSLGSRAGYEEPPVPSWEQPRSRGLDRGGVGVGPSSRAPVAGFAPLLLNFAKGEIVGAGGGGAGGDVGAGVSGASAAVAEGLLSQRLRSLGMVGGSRGEDGGEGGLRRG